MIETGRRTRIDHCVPDVQVRWCHVFEKQNKCLFGHCFKSTIFSAKSNHHANFQTSFVSWCMKPGRIPFFFNLFIYVIHSISAVEKKTWAIEAERRYRGIWQNSSQEESPKCFSRLPALFLSWWSQSVATFQCSMSSTDLPDYETSSVSTCFLLLFQIFWWRLLSCLSRWIFWLHLGKDWTTRFVVFKVFSSSYLPGRLYILWL